MTSFTSTMLGRTDATTDELGRFRLHGVPAGEVDIHAESDDEIWVGVLSSLRVSPGELVEGALVTVEEVPAGRRIEGVVLDHRGEPARYARIRMEWRKFFSKGFTSTTADAEGRFVEIVPRGVSVDMWFTGRGGEPVP